jgi:hypothetical protein
LEANVPSHTIREENLSWREVDKEIIILDLGSSKYLSLNGTGALLWKRLAIGADDAELVDLLVDSFRIDRAVAENDVRAFLDHCSSLGILN